MKICNVGWFIKNVLGCRMDHKEGGLFLGLLALFWGVLLCKVISLRKVGGNTLAKNFGAQTRAYKSSKSFVL